MAKFDNAKVGDKVWSSSYGWGKIVAIYEYSIGVGFDGAEGQYEVNGKEYEEAEYPSLFWNEFHIPTEEEDKKPFDLVGFLRENVSCVEFKHGEKNYYLYYNEDSKKFSYSRCDCVDFLGTVYLDSGDFKYVVEELNKNKITPQQVKDAYKQLNWM